MNQRKKPNVEQINVHSFVYIPMAGQLNPCTCQPIIVKGHVHQKANHSDLASKVSFLSKLQPLVNKKANGKNKAIGVISGQPGEQCAYIVMNI